MVSLKQHLITYIEKTITKPQKKLGGLPVCPFAKKFRKDIEVIICEDWNEKIDQTCQLIGPLGLEAVAIGGPNTDFDELEKICDKNTRKHKNKDVEILFMHPESVEPPLPIKYNFKNSPIVIVQRASTLKKHRKMLKKHSKYYDYYK